MNHKSITAGRKNTHISIPLKFCDELVMFHCPIRKGWAPLRSSCGQYSPATAADHGSSHGTPLRKVTITINKLFAEAKGCVFVFYYLTLHQRPLQLFPPILKGSTEVIPACVHLLQPLLKVMHFFRISL